MRKTWEIHGGIHPQENKHQSLQQPIEAAGLPPQLILPLAQHIGAPASPVVEVGQQVLKGQLIAEAKGLVSVPIHTSSSGVVSAIEDRLIPHPSGMSAPCIVIDTDGRDQWQPHQGVADYRQLDRLALLEHIRNAGIAGMGGAGFPTAVKLHTRDEKPIETLILNGTECEPYITADDVLMRERADQVIAGAQILRHLVQPARETLIGIEDNKPEAIAALQKAAEGSGIEVVAFATKYPSGGEKQLIQILTGKEVPSSGLPADIGIVCQNVGTAVAIYRAVELGEPLISRITTVTGDACQRPGNYETLLGTPVQFLLEKAGFQYQQCLRLVMGGPMMGYTLPDPAVPVVKTSNCILAPTAAELPPPPPAQACIRCGMCSEVCPASLLPQQMYWFARSQEHDKLEAHNLFDCIECGACSYVCPSHIPLVQYYRAAKGEIRQAQQDRMKAERSKERFEARQARLEREEAEKEARRKARMEAAKAKSATSPGSKSDVIQAAIERSKAKKAGAAETGDPAQAAIARAQAARSGDQPAPSLQEEVARLENQLASTEKRLHAAREKLEQARQEGSANLDAFAKAVDTTERKFQVLTEELAAQRTSAATTAQAPAEEDPAQAAIRRAQARRAAPAQEETPAEKMQRLEKQIAGNEKKLQAAQQKLAQARKNAQSEPEQPGAGVTALQSAVGKLTDKLDQSRRELAALTQPTSPLPSTSGAKTAGNDPAQAAIERAMAGRRSQAEMSEADKLEHTIESLQKRLDRSREKLAQAQEDGDGNAEILEEAVRKLEAKLDAAQRQLAQQQA